MYSLIETEEFTVWMTGLKDRMTRARLMVRLNKAKAGKRAKELQNDEQDKDPAV